MCQVRKKGKEKVKYKKKEPNAVGQYEVRLKPRVYDQVNNKEERCKLQRKADKNRGQDSKQKNNDGKGRLQRKQGRRKTEPKGDLENHNRQRNDKERNERRERRENRKKELELIEHVSKVRFILLI